MLINDLVVQFRSKGKKVKAIKGANLNIYEKETFAMVGESGSGKTTIGRAIVGIQPIKTGTVYMNNKIVIGQATNLYKLNKKIYKLLVEMETNTASATKVFEDYLDEIKISYFKFVENKKYNPSNGKIKNLPGEIENNVEDILEEMDENVEIEISKTENQPQISLSEVDDKKIKQYLALNMLKSVGMLPEHLSRYPHEFSGGQRQRIGIARALVMKPKFIVADEPISALDVSIRAQVLNLLKKFQEELGLTYMFVAHDLSIVRFIADRIAVIYHGDIVEVAEAEELFNNPLHPYTRSLLSAIPHPDPKQKVKKVHYVYDPQVEHADYLTDYPNFTEVKPGHFVLCNQREEKEILNGGTSEIADEMKTYNFEKDNGAPIEENPLYKELQKYVTVGEITLEDGRTASTITYKLNQVAPYFDTLMTYTVFSPIPDKAIAYQSVGGKGKPAEGTYYTYGTDYKRGYFSGAYIPVHYDPSVTIQLKKNPNYVNRDQVSIENIDLIYLAQVTDSKERIYFESGDSYNVILKPSDYTG
ncbi:hypothetical protein FQR65_LT15349 [Abscondita terminalis]|nr:hypothetical protein FQR65_LT15349 [Abscondita terminalis]